MNHVEQLDRDLFLIDTHYNRTPQAIGVFLLTGDRPALIETGPASRVDSVLEGIQSAGLRPEDLQAVAVTHIHLDHAGAVGALARRYPALDVYVHAAGAPHLVDPSRLIASAGRLYGEALDPLFGAPSPIPEDRIRILQDGQSALLGSRRIVALDTPGHAPHHLAFWDAEAGDLFTGDAAGVSLPGSRYVRPPTPPPEVNVPAWKLTLSRLEALAPRRLLLTHFGAHTEVEFHLGQVRERLDTAVAIVRNAIAEGLDDEMIAAQLQHRMLADITAIDGPEQARRQEIILSTRLSAVGLIRHVRRQG